MPDAVTHPSLQQLSDFGLGRLPAAAAATVADHLETCPACQQAVAELPPDSFLGKVRAAKPGQSSILRGRSAGLTGAANLLDSAAAPPEGLPPELASYSKYRFVRELGHGGMGVVYQAEQTLMGRSVAVKVISPSVLAHPDALPRFHAEVRAAAKLDHPNIVRAYDAEPVGSLHLLVMEYVEGVNLADLVQRKGPLPVAHACHFIRQAALGLQHAFEQGMVHRDIKPQNLMVSPKGQVKILDFGLARLRGGGRGLTEMGSFMGTPEYVSPEQATDARTADIRADLYSLGCTLYFLLTGRPPFPEDTAVKVILAHIEKAIPSVQKLRPEVPAELSAVVARLLAKDPKQRFQTPVEAARALVPFIKQGTKREGVSSLSLAMPVADRGTVLGANTSKILTPQENPIGQPPPPPAAVKDKATPLFADPVGAAARGTKENRVRPAEAVPVAWYHRPPMRFGVGAAMLALAVGAWVLAGVVFKMKTKDGILVVEVNEPNAEVYLNGEKVVVTWDDGGKKAEIHPKPGTYQVEVKKDGFTVHGEQVTLEGGGRQVLRAQLIKIPTPPDKSGDFVPLFNGKDTTGWKSHPTSKAKWVAKDGVLIGSGGTGYLFTDGKNYENFHLRVQAMINDGGNSGVYFRTLFGPAKPDGACAQIDANSIVSEAKTGSLFVRDQVPANLKESPVKSGEWFMLEVIANGPYLVIKVNGRVTAAYTDTAPKPDGGQIALEVNDTDTVIKFRTIEIKELPLTKPEGSPATAQPPPIPAFKVRETSELWKVKGDEYIHRFEGEPDPLLFGNDDWIDYTLSFKVKLSDGQKGLSVFTHYDENGNTWWLKLGQANKFASFWRIGPTTYTLGGAATHAVDGTLESNSWHDIRVQVRARTLKLIVDDKWIFTRRAAGEAKGYAGIDSSSPQSWWKDLRVVSPRGEVLWRGPSGSSPGGG